MKSLSQNRKHALLLIATGVVVLMIGLVIALIKTESKKEETQTPIFSKDEDPCLTQDFLDRATLYLFSDDVSKADMLRQLQDKILLIDKYHRSANCLWPLLKSNLVVDADVKEAQRILTQLEEVYDESTFASDRYSIDLEGIRITVRNAELSKQRLREGGGSFFISDPDYPIESTVE